MQAGWAKGALRATLTISQSRKKKEIMTGVRELSTSSESICQCTEEHPLPPPKPRQSPSLVSSEFFPSAG